MKMLQRSRVFKLTWRMHSCWRACATLSAASSICLSLCPSVRLSVYSVTRWYHVKTTRRTGRVNFFLWSWLMLSTSWNCIHRRVKFKITLPDSPHPIIFSRKLGIQALRLAGRNEFRFLFNYYIFSFLAAGRCPKKLANLARKIMALPDSGEQPPGLVTPMTSSTVKGPWIPPTVNWVKIGANIFSPCSKIVTESGETK